MDALHLRIQATERGTARGPLSQTELGQIMNVDKSVTVSLLNPLEESRLVSRKRDSADRRRHLVTLTTAGRRQLDKAARAQRDAEATLFAGVPSDELTSLTRGLVALRDSLASAECTATDNDGAS